MRAALVEMQRQVGTLATDGDGIARHGLMIRHLVLPNDLAGTAETMCFIAEELDPQTYVNVMAQYRPCHDADAHLEVDRPVTADEIAAARQAATGVGLAPRV
jgi:putative pyruvate formate lyase activating enzyme